jgi:hypothetical protein
VTISGLFDFGLGSLIFNSFKDHISGAAVQGGKGDWDMKIILWVVMLTVMAVAGCASSQYSQSSYQDKQVLQEYIQNHPDFYEKIKQEQP